MPAWARRTFDNTHGLTRYDYGANAQTAAIARRRRHRRRAGFFDGLSAHLVRRAEDWQWSSLWLRLNGGARDGPALSAWPVARPRHWRSWVNQPQTPQALQALRLSVQRGRPYGNGGWQKRIAKRLGLESTFRARGRPRKGA